MLKVAMLSKWHVHAEGYARAVRTSGLAETAAVWDDDPERGARFAASLECEYIPDLDALLARPEIDAVVCDAPTAQHKDVLIRAARAGKHIFTEKALAPSVEECLEVKRAVEAAGVIFVISFPQLGGPVMQFARRMIAEGQFGRITMVRTRMAHGGVSGHWLPEYWFDKEDAGGGAMMDLGCHPMYLLAALCGAPVRVSGLFTSPLGKPVDENAVAVAEFADGVLGIAETSFDSYNSPTTLEIYGTEGTLIAHGDDDVRFASHRISSAVKGFVKPTLPAPQPAPIMRFLDACANGTEPPQEMNIDAAITLTELLESAYLSSETSRIVHC